jgi:hypothetical protein
MSIRSLLLAFAADNNVSVECAAQSLHSSVDVALEQYKAEGELFQAACDDVLTESPSITKEALVPMVAMALTRNNPGSFPEVLRSVSEYVALTYVGKRGRRRAGDETARLSKR